jgi:hypothetical protein
VQHEQKQILRFAQDDRIGCGAMQKIASKFIELSHARSRAGGSI